MAADGGRPLALTPPPSSVLRELGICDMSRAQSRKPSDTSDAMLQCIPARQCKRYGATAHCPLVHDVKRRKEDQVRVPARMPASLCSVRRQRAAAQQSGMLHAGALHRVASPAIAAVKAPLPRQGSGLLRLSMLLLLFWTSSAPEKAARQCSAVRSTTDSVRHTAC